MSKFKVGDKVRGTASEEVYGYTNKDMTLGIVERIIPIEERSGDFDITVRLVQTNGARPSACFVYAVNSKHFELVEPPREFIVIRRQDRDVIASHKRGDEIVKTAKAKCALSDEFNFETGAKLAFDRLMWREEPKRESLADLFARLEKSTPQPAPRFKVGDRVVCDVYGEGVVEKIEFSIAPEVPYGIKCKSGYFHWASERDLSPAPEPKYYSGKVLAVRTKGNGAGKDMIARVGHVFEIKDGIAIGDTFWGEDMRFKTFLAFCNFYSATEWREVKE